MRETEVDGTPGEVEEPDENAMFSPGERDAGGWLRSALIVLPLLVGLLVAAAMGARMLLAEIPDPTDPAAETVTMYCWDGEVRPDEGCPVPSGRAGLRWVFPSFRPSELGCRNVLEEFPKSTRPAMFACELDVDGSPVTIIYSQLTQVARGRATLEKQYAGPGQEIAGERRLLWTEGDDPGPDGDYELAVMYAALPFSVEITGDSAQTRDEALETLVRFRPANDVMDH